MSQPFSPQLRTTIAGLWTGNLFAPFLVSGVAAMLPAIGASLEGSAVALSVGKYFTPKGVSLAEVGGLTPDVVVEVDEQTASGIYSQTLALMEDPQVLAAIALLQKES